MIERYNCIEETQQQNWTHNNQWHSHMLFLRMLCITFGEFTFTYTALGFITRYLQAKFQGLEWPQKAPDLNDCKN